MSRKASTAILLGYSAAVVGCAALLYWRLPHLGAYHRLPAHVENAQPLRLRVSAAGKEGERFATRAYAPGQVERFVIRQPVSQRLPLPDRLKEGGVFIGRALKSGDEKVAAAIAVERDRKTVVLAAGFFLLLAMVAGVQGVRTAVALVAAVLLVAFVLLPLSLRGWNPLTLVVPLACALLVVTLPLISGWNAKTRLAIAASVFGVTVGATLAFWCCHWLHFIGLDVEFGANFHLGTQYWYNKSLRYVRFDYLLVAGMILSSLGVVMDVSITVCSAVSELKRKAPDLDRRALLAAGTRVGHDILCMMAMTLGFVSIASELDYYVMLSQAGDWRAWVQAVNVERMAAEIVRLVVCSIAMLVAMTTAAVLAGWHLGGTGPDNAAPAVPARMPGVLGEGVEP